MLMADGGPAGGQNPWCLVSQSNPDCSTVVTPFQTPQGDPETTLHKAGRFVFAFLDHLSPSHGWDDLANEAKIAAYLAFAGEMTACAVDEQQTVMDAFTAIGYPPGNTDPVCDPQGGGSGS
jgi:hypothetical protein